MIEFDLVLASFLIMISLIALFIVVISYEWGPFILLALFVWFWVYMILLHHT